MLSSKILDGNRATNQTALKRINFHIPFKKYESRLLCLKGVKMEIDKKRYLKLSTKDRSYHIKIRVEYLMDQLDLVCGHMHISKPPSEEFINDLWKSLDEMIYEQVKEAKELRSILDQGAVGKA